MKKHIEINHLYPDSQKPSKNATPNRYYTIEYTDGTGGEIRNFITGEEALNYAKSTGYTVYIRLSNMAGGAIKIK